MQPNVVGIQHGTSLRQRKETNAMAALSYDLVMRSLERNRLADDPREGLRSHRPAS